ncbi:MAG: phosphate acyltransferase PlsX [Deltaproteobacteria bacterium]|nr:MAG: phosphate acyltransferase PlsX [Deltaproteobacteria bacterium]
MRVAVDAMGGDYAPGAVVLGAVEAARGLRGEVVLVGKAEVIRRELEDLEYPKRKLRIVHAPEVITMEESPSRAVRAKPQSSIHRAIELMAQGEVDAVVTAGNSGAALAVAMLKLKRLPGVERPALVSLHPSLRGYTVVLDVGGNVECRPSMLVQFAIMGEIYSRLALGRERPTVGLLSNGTEETKGTEVTRKAHEILKKCNINYVGYVEGRDIYYGDVDVVVCDGFVGNVVLKAAEGIGDFLRWKLRQEAKRSLLSRVLMFLSGGLWRKVLKEVDYTSYGGVPLLGVNGVCFICHGHSSPKAIAQAIRAASDYVLKDVNGSMVKALEENQEFRRWAFRFWERLR